MERSHGSFATQSVTSIQVGKRYIMMQKFNWKTDGSPDFGIPEDAGKPLQKTSGEC